MPYSFHECNLALGVLGCVNEPPLLYVYSVSAAWTLIVAVVGFALLWHRVVNKKFPIFYRGSGFFIRPKPIESMLLFLSVSSIIEFVKTLLLVLNVSISQYLGTILGSLPREFATCAFSCYLFGIAHTICSSRKFGNQRYEMSKRIDIMCTIFIILPFVTSNICAIVIAAILGKPHIEESDVATSDIFFKIQYFQWLVYWSILAAWILLAGLRLIQILKKHMHIQSKQGNAATIQKSKTGLFKVRMTMAIGISSMLIFMLLRYLYSFLGERSHEDYNLTLGFSIVIIYHSTLASTLIIVTMLLNPRALNPISASAPVSDESLESYDSANATKPNDFALHTEEATLVMAHSKVQTSNANLYSQSPPDQDNYMYKQSEQITSMSDILLLPSPPPLNK
ncbi:hypothetical protein BD408DRAFT_448562 [Parasitella parasitica]|nr:hypothetical protein BD408DRAFT_448562 [Parasitella parasitica]